MRLPDGIRRPVAVVVGQLNERTDPAMLQAVADLDLSLVIIGPVPALANAAWLDELLARENVVWMGPQRRSNCSRCRRFCTISQKAVFLERLADQTGCGLSPCRPHHRESS